MSEKQATGNTNGFRLPFTISIQECLEKLFSLLKILFTSINVEKGYLFIESNVIDYVVFFKYKKFVRLKTGDICAVILTRPKHCFLKQIRINKYVYTVI